MNAAAAILLCLLLLPGCSKFSNDDLPTSDAAPDASSPTPVAAADADGDGYDAGDDCDDQDAEVHPGALELCGDGLDNDCNGASDDGAAVDATSWHVDLDGDGYGSSSQAVSACTAPPGTIEDGTDCDDWDEGVYPGALERCNDGTDSDCDGEDDDLDAVDAGTWYADADEDGYGDPDAGTTACAPPEGYIADSTDCDDSSATTNPMSLEVCDDGLDNDCDGFIDQADGQVWYLDADGDGYGDPGSVQSACAPPEGYVADDADCADLDPSIHPGADELCDGIDQDCDGVADDDAIDAGEWHHDADADGYGSADDTAAACDQPEGYLIDALDCDDQDPAVNPAADEVCDPANTDENCNGKADDADSTTTDESKTPHYPDSDGDGYGAEGASQGLLLCDPISGYTGEATDCDDTDPTVFPSAEETSDGRDEDCDGTIDEGTTTYDDDGDGFAEAAGDCDDSSPAVKPGAQEQCNGIDDDCDGIEDNLDADADGYVAQACGGDDCDDQDATRHPGAAEDGGTGTGEPNGADDDCDGEADEDLPGTDDDGDGFSELEGDCDDVDAGTRPGAPELLDGLDNDCDDAVQTAFGLGDAPASWSGTLAGAWAGFSVAIVPDVNGDGYADLVVGAPHHDPTAQETGAAYLIFGAAGGWSSGRSLGDEVTFVANEAYAEAGWSVASAGDYNNDGLGDFAVGAPGYPSGGHDRAGAAYLLAGARSGWFSEDLGDRSFQLADPADSSRGTLGSSIYGIDEDVQLGYSLAGGDVNGDSLDDLLVGGPCDKTSYACGTSSGWLMILPGAGTLDEEGTLYDVAKLQGGSFNAIGFSVATIGYTDNDNYADMLVGGTYSSDDEGMVVRLRGSDAITSNVLIPSADALLYTGDSDDEWISQSISGAGDVDGDQLDDYLVGRAQLNGDLELAFLFYGGSTDTQPPSGTISSSAPVSFTGTAADACPCVVAGLGDLDGDGYGDFAIGAAGNSETGSGAGKIYLFFGRSGGFSGQIPVSEADYTLTGEVAGDAAGNALSGGQDLNGDGYADFVIAAPYHDSDQADSGRIYVYFGFPR